MLDVLIGRRPGGTTHDQHAQGDQDTGHHGRDNGVGADPLAAGPALAHTCTNASKQPDAGVQVVFDAFSGEIVWTTNGVAQRIANGVIDPTTGEGFHGLIGFDLDGDAVADVSIWEGVGPDGQIPVVAQDAGSECRGVMSIDEFIAACADLDV